MASWAVMAYSWGLMMFSLVKVLAPGFFARQDTRTPVRASLVALAVNMAMNIRHRAARLAHGIPRAAHPARHRDLHRIAVNAWLLFRGLRRAGV